VPFASVQPTTHVTVPNDSDEIQTILRSDYQMSAAQKVFATFEGDQSRGSGFRVPGSDFGRQVEAVDRVEEEQRPNPLIQILAPATEGVELGARSTDPSCFQDGKVQFHLVAKIRAFQDGLKRLLTAAASHRLALMCAEKDPLQCHRTMLICRNLRKEPVSITHILADGSLETQAELEERLLALEKISQDDLFLDRDQLIERAYDLLSRRMTAAIPTTKAPSTRAGAETPICGMLPTMTGNFRPRSFRSWSKVLPSTRSGLTMKMPRPKARPMTSSMR
jgi:hypothetical protein